MNSFQTILRPGSKHIRLTVTSGGDVRYKTPGGTGKSAKFRAVAEQVISEGFSTTMRGKVSANFSPEDTITMYNDAKSIQRTYTLWGAI